MAKPVKQSNMRMVFLSDAIQERNGVGSYYRDLVEHLYEHVAVTTLLCPGPNGNSAFQYFALPLPGDPTQKMFVPNIRKVIHAIRQINPDIIVSPTPGPFGILGLMLSKLLKLPICVGYHTRYDKLLEIYFSGIAGGLAHRFMNLFNRLFFRYGSAVVATNEAMAENVRSHCRSAVHVVGTPVAKPFLDNPFRLPCPDIQSVLYAGRLAPEKNIDSVIEAATRLPSIRFVIAGDGPARDEVHRHARSRPNLDYIGWVSRRDIRSVIDHCDMLVLPSQIESFGTAALEAMARSKLVLVSPNCGILNWPDLAGAVYRMQPQETLTAAIERINRLDTAAKIQTAHKAREAARDLNTKTVHQWLDICRTVIEDHSKTQLPRADELQLR